MCFSKIPSNQCYVVCNIWYSDSTSRKYLILKEKYEFTKISNIIKSYKDLSSFKLAFEIDVNSLKWCYNWNKEWYKYQKTLMMLAFTWYCDHTNAFNGRSWKLILCIIPIVCFDYMFLHTLICIRKCLNPFFLPATSYLKILHTLKLAVIVAKQFSD